VEAIVKRTAKALLVDVFLVGISPAQKKEKSWTDWSKKEAEKILKDSPWGQTYIVTDTSEMTYSPTITSTTADRRDDRNVGRVERGAVNQEVYVKYNIRFLSAKPIRQAFCRLIEIEQGETNKQLAEQLRSFVDRNFGEYIVISVGFESNDQRFSGPVMQEINSAVASTLKNSTYLERKDGKRLFLMDYRAPISDGLGAKFIFPRTFEESHFLNADSGEVRFFSELGKKVKLDMRFKVADMTYDGRLEY
jgi:hypothetical protein